jgi:hypothetical protein
MNLPVFLKWLQASTLATRIRESVFLFPMIESTHVLGLTMVFGTIAIVDLRLLGLASAHRSFQRMASDILKWTWAAFVLTVLTGALMFITNATVYYHNTYFRLKMVLLVLSGLNMMVFELTDGRRIHQWDKAPSAPRLGKAAAALSITLWIGVIVLGRLTGFTTSRAAVVAPPPASNFDDFLGGPTK